MTTAQESSALRAVELAALEARLHQDLSWFELPVKDRTLPHTLEEQPVLDMAVIGGGTAGPAASVSLKHLGIGVVVFDCPPAGFGGLQATTARVETLRSSKQLTGPALSLPTLTSRAWFEAQFDTDAWKVLGKTPHLQWVDYLRWYCHALQFDVRNEHHVETIRPRVDGAVELLIDAPGQPTQRMSVRRVVLATDRDRLGGLSVPDFARRLPRRWWAHPFDEMDYGTPTGKRAGVIGAGASVMDSAAMALEAGAVSVDMLIRCPDLPCVNKGEGAGSPGLVHGHLYLPDAWKWRIRHCINVEQVSLPRGSISRVSWHPNARFSLGCDTLGVDEHDGVLHVATTKGVFQLDLLISSTGLRADWAPRPEFSVLAPHIRQWCDRYTPRPGEEDAEFADSPDLGYAFGPREKTPSTLSGLSRVYCFCYPAPITHGSVLGDILAISEGAKRLAQDIAGLLYQEDIDVYYVAIQAYTEPEIFGDEWTSAPSPGVEANATSGQEAA